MPASHRLKPLDGIGLPRPSVTATRKCALEVRLAPTAIRRIAILWPAVPVGERLVRLDNLLHELVTDHVALVEINERDALDGAHDLHRLDQARDAADGQVDLRDIAGNDRLRAEPQARQEHLHL